MIFILLKDLFATLVASLPTLFLLGAPFLLLLVALAAFVDARLPCGREPGLHG